MSLKIKVLVAVTSVLLTACGGEDQGLGNGEGTHKIQIPTVGDFDQVHPTQESTYNYAQEVLGIDAGVLKNLCEYNNIDDSTAITKVNCLHDLSEDSLRITHYQRTYSDQVILELTIDNDSINELIVKPRLFLGNRDLPKNIDWEFHGQTLSYVSCLDDLDRCIYPEYESAFFRAEGYSGTPLQGFLSSDFVYDELDAMALSNISTNQGKKPYIEFKFTDIDENIAKVRRTTFVDMLFFQKLRPVIESAYGV
ncbi:MAG: hypothetical protein MHMPM18_004657 [Marteilia pararefringens]